MILIDLRYDKFGYYVTFLIPIFLLVVDIGLRWAIIEYPGMFP